MLQWIFAKQNFEGLALQAAQPRINIDQNTKIFTPRVEVLCNSFSNDNFDPRNPNSQTTMFFPSFGGVRPIQVPDWVYKYSRPITTSNFSFIQTAGMGPEPPSLGAVLVVPILRDLANGSLAQSTENIACSIYASWIPINAWYEPTVNNHVSYDIKGSMSNTCLEIPDDPDSGRQSINTTIDVDYATAINAPVASLTSAPNTQPCLQYSNI